MIKDLPTLTGLEIINGMRRRLTKYIADKIEEGNDIDETFNVITGYMAVADALDIITDKEYSNATGDLYHFLTGLRDEPVVFADRDDKELAEHSFQEELVLCRIKLQERLNHNFEIFRSNAITMMECSKQDVLEANDLMLTFAVNFNIIEKKDYDKAVKVMKEYAANKPKTDKIIFVPEELYHTL